MTYLFVLVQFEINAEGVRQFQPRVVSTLGKMVTMVFNSEGVPRAQA